MKECFVVDLGLIAYTEACALQQALVCARRADAVPDVLLLCEHPHVITLARNGKREHLLASDHLLRQMRVEFCESDRGGDITYHGPGQVVGYPIVKLSEIRRDVGWYVRQLEEAMIRTSGDFGISAKRLEEKTGVWVSVSGEHEEKLGAIGVHLSRWVTSHGFAYNVSTDLRYFDLIVPCGITGKRATSLEKLLGRIVPREAVTSRVTKHFGDVFGFQMRAATREEFENSYGALHEVSAHA